jgi:hypothetical protein
MAHCEVGVGMQHEQQYADDSGVDVAQQQRLLSLGLSIAGVRLQPLNFVP